MEIFGWDKIADFSSLYGNGTALTVGSFDGPHRGHDVLFDEVRKAASRDALVPGVVTFSKSAAEFHASGKYVGDITTLDQRLKIFREYGMSFALVIDFSGDFIKIKGEEFLSTLVSVLRMKFIAEGTDFRCGWKGLFGRDEIAAFAFEHNVESVFHDLVFDYGAGGKRISSTLIRDCIVSKDFKMASSLLGRSYAIDAKPLFWQTCSDENSVSTSQCTQVLPPDGEYDVVAKKIDTTEIKTKFFVDGQNLRLVFPHKQIKELESIEFIN